MLLSKELLPLELGAVAQRVWSPAEPSSLESRTRPRGTTQSSRPSSWILGHENQPKRPTQSKQLSDVPCAPSPNCHSFSRNGLETAEWHRPTQTPTS